MTATPTTSEIVNHLIRERWQQAFVLPTYAPDGWWECDVLEITKAGYWHEYEVKVSRADFLRDAAKKRRDSWKYEGGVRIDLPGARKHDLLAAGSTKGPSRFTYVAPAGLLALADVPEWAGLMEATRMPGRFGGPDRIGIRTAKAAPRIHGEKFGDRRTRAMELTCYYRFHRAGHEEFEDREGI